jgi:hypothetical protein
MLASEQLPQNVAACSRQSDGNVGNSIVSQRVGLACSLLRDWKTNSARLCCFVGICRRHRLERTLIVKTQKLLLAATLLLTLVPSISLAQPGDTEVTPLNNRDVLLMVERKLETEAIIKVIKSAPCTFDTFPPLLKEMKRRGVPQAVLQAMVEAPYGPSTSNSSKDDLGETPIYHYAEQLRQMGFMTPVPTGRGLQPMRSSRGRSSRARMDQ